MFHSRIVHAGMVAALLITGWLLFGVRALAIQDSEDKVWFGPLGVGVGQGVRINVYTTGTTGVGGILVPDTRWEFAVKVFNTRGVVVQERRFRVAPGAIASFDVNIGNPDEFPMDRLGRRTLRAEVVGISPPPDPDQPPPDPDQPPPDGDKYGATLEIYSLITGHTSILLGGPDTLGPVAGAVR